MPSKRDKVDHSKPCTLCHTRRDVLVRCQIDESNKWHMVCPGTCWKKVSGGVMDGDGKPEHQFYRYGGMWKNKHEAVSAKKPKGLGVVKKPAVDDPAVQGDVDREDSVPSRADSDS